MREVCSNGGDSDGAGAGSPVHKPDLEKVRSRTPAQAHKDTLAHTGETQNSERIKTNVHAHVYTNTST